MLILDGATGTITLLLHLESIAAFLADGLPSIFEGAPIDGAGRTEEVRHLGSRNNSCEEEGTPKDIAASNQIYTLLQGD
jgi:hypothetical protein